MNRKRDLIVSSTPHPALPHRLRGLFEDVKLSPIIVEAHQPKIPIDPQPKPTSSKPSGAQRTGAIRKRKVETKRKAATEAVSDGVLKELGLDARDVCNNALSQSRNLYNMYPEPIILDSDDENSEITVEPVKKNKQDSKVVQSSTTNNKQDSKVVQSSTTKNKQDSKVVQSSTTKKHEEKKTKDRVPGSSRISQLTRSAAGRKTTKQSSIQPSNNVPVSSKDIKTTSKTKQTRKKLPDNRENSPSVVLLNDDDDSDSSFPVYQPGSSIYRSTVISKVKEKGLSLELDEKFPIEWSSRRKKTPDNKRERVSNVSDIQVRESNDVKATCTRRGRTVVTRSKPTVSGNDGHDKINNNEQKENPVLISRFEDVIFKANKACGGIIAQCLKNDQNDIGYLEISPDQVFNGQRANITFVVIEGKVKADHLGVQQTLSPGDMIHIQADSGYEFRSAGAGHVRFLYIKAH